MNQIKLCRIKWNLVSSESPSSSFQVKHLHQGQEFQNAKHQNWM